jgi:hypothetical protein
MKKETVRIKTVKSISKKEAVLEEKRKQSMKKRQRVKRDFFDE